ncbi:MAG: ATP-binding protein [Microscillaceae bacterium]|nr:ATP-binding protein [Microscillaceae bacterium]
MKALRIQIPSLVENLRIVESFIDNAKEKHQIDDDIYGNIMIAVTESVNNAIKHGNQEDEKKNVSLIMEVEEDKIRFRVEDEGPGFDYEHLDDPTAPDNLNKPGGRGIFLMRHLSDEVNFAQNGRVVELVFYVT